MFIKTSIVALVVGLAATVTHAAEVQWYNTRSCAGGSSIDDPRHRAATPVLIPLAVAVLLPSVFHHVGFIGTDGYGFIPIDWLAVEVVTWIYFSW